MTSILRRVAASVVSGGYEAFCRTCLEDAFQEVLNRGLTQTAPSGCSRLSGVSPLLSRTNLLRALVFVLVLAAVLLAGARLYGAYRWNAGTQELRARLDAARAPVRPQTVDFRELQGLPAPVQRYFRAALEEGQPMVAGVNVRHQGTFNMGETSDRWKPFSSDQKVVTRRPGFDWDGRVAMAPGLPVRVHDAYVTGEGVLHASVLGLFPVVDMRGRGEVAEGELMRFFAEAPWYPTALLPSQGVLWEPVDDSSTLATLDESDITIKMLFTFNGEGLIESVRAEARGRTVGDEVVPTPWRGRFWNYDERGGMKVPLDGEVAWVLPESDKPYWRGHITEISYEFAR